MASNDPAAYGLTVSCWDDADEFFTTINGIEGIAQDLYHRWTNDVFLGEGGEDEGIDVTKLAGMPADKLARRGPILAEVATRDERIESADVRVIPSRIAGTRWAATIEGVFYTALGPFRRVFAFNDREIADITNALEGDA